MMIADELYKEEPIMKRTLSLTLFGFLLLTGCTFRSSSFSAPTETALPAMIFFSTETPSPLPPATSTSILTPTATSIPPVAANVCVDPQAVAVIDSLKASMLRANGPLLSSIVSPNGMEVRYFHNGKAIKYTSHQAQFLFETTYEANWGEHPASGLEKKGTFHDVVVPDLIRIFNTSYTLHCNEIRYGGATYPVTWPYNKDFYSIYYAGTETNGYMDWHTWVAGIEYVGGKPYLYALIQFFWEP
jgi:hypothetical protein